MTISPHAAPLAEYHFATPLVGYRDWHVVDVHGVEELSRSFRFAVTLSVDEGESTVPVDVDALVGGAATLAVQSGDGHALRHGLVTDVEELERAPSRRLYRVVFGSYLENARHRQRCRTLFGRTLREIVDLVLGVDGCGLEPVSGRARDLIAASALLPVTLDGYAAATRCFAWHLTDEETIARVDHATLYEYTVQYNESDLAFVSRLLEREGVSHFFEHTPTHSVLTLTDRPGSTSVFAELGAYRISPDEGLADGGDRVLRWMRAARRQRSRAVTMRDYDWGRAGHTLEGSSKLGHENERDLATHFEFPAGDEAVRDRPCTYPARIRRERFDVERASSEGAGALRELPLGRRIRVEDASGASRGEHLIVRVETVAVQRELPSSVLADEPFGFDGRSPRKAGTHQVRFVALEAALPFRPAMSTPRPRIDGVQSAVVTGEDNASSAEQSSEHGIHTDEWSRVRVRFPWDQRDDGRPSSRWIRVSQAWAGAGYGALMVPRVGSEVLVAFVDGDPDQPLVVGRVYNARNPLPTSFDSAVPTVSTLKSQTFPGEGGNELRFQDAASREEIYLHAQRDLTEVVLNDHATDVRGDHTRKVTGGEDVVVGGDRGTTIGGDATTRIDGDANTTIRGDRHLRVSGEETRVIDGDASEQVDGDVSRTLTGNLDVAVGGDHGVHTQGFFNSVADRGHALTSKGDFTSRVTEDHHFSTHKAFRSNAGDKHVFHSPEVKVSSEHTELAQSETFVARVGACFIKISRGMITLNDGAGASISLVGGKLLVNTESALTIASSEKAIIKAPAIQLDGGSAEREDEVFVELPETAKFVFRVHAQDEDAHPLWEGKYTLEALDGSFVQTLAATADDERHDKGHSDLEFTDVPIGKKYELRVERPDGDVEVLLTAYEFDG
ncbi:MAG: type VI secretion system tip protein TssI/VgrG [Polyangiaceae bacterium]